MLHFPYFVYNFRWYNSGMTLVDLDEDKEMFKFKDLLWIPRYHRSITRHKTVLLILGPYCPKCRIEIGFDSADATAGVCLSCSQSYNLEKSLQQTKELAAKFYEGKKREHLPVISLDMPPGIVKAENENEDFWIEARLGEKQGKLQGIIYMGKKIRGQQNKKDYAQIILDPEDEQMRFDKGNQHPMEILSKVTVEFKNSKVTQETNEENGSK